MRSPSRVAHEADVLGAASRSLGLPAISRLDLRLHPLEILLVLGGELRLVLQRALLPAADLIAARSHRPGSVIDRVPVCCALCG